MVSDKPGTVHNEKDFESWLEVQSCSKDKSWIKEINGTARPSYSVTLMTFIRNHIHHPENTTMQGIPYTGDELKLSIDEMIRVLKINNYHAI